MRICLIRPPCILLSGVGTGPRVLRDRAGGIAPEPPSVFNRFVSSPGATSARPAAVDLDRWPRRVREIVLHQSRRADVGHIGSALSVVEILVALYGRVMRWSALDDPARDRFILSKGHAALALYAVLSLKGVLTEAQLHSFCCDDSLLGVHPDHRLPGVEFSTGSLGHGLSIGAGVALAARLQGSPSRVFVLLSDAELNEGSVWEAAMFAAHHRLANLVAVVDCNAQQALGHTKDVLDLQPLAERWRAFGWDVHERPGHDIEDLARTVEQFDTAPGGPPHIVIAHTVFGRGVSYMEREIRWHYMPMTDEEYAWALAEVRMESAPDSAV